MKKLILNLVLTLVPLTYAYSQKIHIFTQGLGIGPCHQYGREALYTDLLAYHLYKGSLQTPKEGTTLSTGNEQKPLKWTTVEADTAHRFRDASFSNGYLYFSYESKTEQVALLNVTGNDMVFVNGIPRGGDMYRYGWMELPIQLKKGKNEFYARVARYGRYGGITARLIFPEKPIALNLADATLPSVVPGLPNDSLWAGIVVTNASTIPLTNLSILTETAGQVTTTSIPAIPALSTRKVPVLINASKANSTGKAIVSANLVQQAKTLDNKSIELEVIETGKHYYRTFVSQIDGSVQYYAVSPQLAPKNNEAPALFFSVHGAEVQAINQARAYKPKDWGVLVAPTNRRPRGFNWEDWGRLDALEVLGIAKKHFKPDPSRIYLTGHSMGGHGTWFLGATYPDQWAAIAPSAGYPTLSSYGSHDGVIPDSAGSAVEAMLLRASNTSNVFALAQNYKSFGVYIAHGDADRTVSVNYARQMKQLLAGFHSDFSYYEYPGGGHWYGDISVDWPPLFNFFSWHSITPDTATHHIDFTTANPGVSGKMKWATIHQQFSPLRYSRIILDRDRATNTIRGTTTNISTLSLTMDAFPKGTEVKIALDSLLELNYTVQGENETLFLTKTNEWALASPPKALYKNPSRNGTFKDPFKNRMIFVYATNGSAFENSWSLNKANYDAGTWYYRGNGAVDIIADKDFDPVKFKDRSVILYGNSSNNLAWNKLLSDSPVIVSTGKVKVGQKIVEGDNLAAYFVRPRKDSDIASVAVIAGTGKEGMQAANANQYFSGGSGFPDVMIFSAEMLKEGAKQVKFTGFFGNDWSVEGGEFESN